MRCLTIPALAFALTTALAGAQTPPIRPEAPARGLTMNVEVTQGDMGKPVAGLQQSDFTVLDNKTPVPIRSFRAMTAADQPVEAVIVVDSVNVEHTRVAYEVDQIERFLRSNGGHLPVPVRLVLFSDRGTQIQPNLSTDGNAEAALLAKQQFGLRAIPRSAGFWGADERLGLSLKLLYQLVGLEGHRPGRKLILWASPGWALMSGPHVQLSTSDERKIFREAVDLTTSMQRGNITLYGIDPLGTEDAGFRAQYYQAYEDQAANPQHVQVANVGLQVLAFESGGLELNSSNDVAGEITRALQDATAYYQITVDEQRGDQPDQLHKLKVTVRQPGLHVRAWQGYYAQP